MFEHFTFGAVSQTCQQDDIHPSPTDTSFPQQYTPSSTSYSFPSSTPSSNINDIVDKFNAHSLSRDELVEQFAAWTRGSTSDDDEDVDMPSFEQPSTCIKHTASVPTTPIDPPIRDTIACRRLQRQLNVQMQTSVTHIRDINTLVEDMIVSNSQCRLHPSKSYLSPPPSRAGFPPLIVDTTSYSQQILDVDEGFHEDECLLEEETETSLRRASTPSGIRKYNANVRWGRSADVALVGGRLKVKSKPRMRKRIKGPASVPE